MRVLRNAVLLWLCLSACSWAGLTNTLWYPPTNAVVRYTDGTNWFFAKDVWREQLGEAVLERMAVVNRYDAHLEYPPVRGPWENEFVAIVKSNLLNIVTDYLDLRFTNSAGVFTNFYNINGASYSNRFWTASNILAFCDLPTNFFDYTPARFLGPNGLTNGNTNIVSGYSTAHYGWEGVYRIVRALSYYQPRPAWREVGVFDGVATGGYESIASTSVCAGASSLLVPSPYDAWVPTNITTNITIATALTPLLGTSGMVYIAQAANGTADEESPGTNAAAWWSVVYDYATPEEASPGAWLRYYTNAFHPTNVLDAQAFATGEGYYTEVFTNGIGTTNYYLAVKLGGAQLTTNGGAVYYLPISAEVATNGLYYLADRSAWPVIQWSTNWVAVSTNPVLADMASVNVTVAEVTQNPPSTNFGYTGYASIPWGDVDGGAGWGPSAAGASLLEGELYFPWTYEVDPCSPSDYLANGWDLKYYQYGLRNNTAVQPAWRWK